MRFAGPVYLLGSHGRREPQGEVEAAILRIDEAGLTIVAPLDDMRRDFGPSSAASSSG